MNGIPAKLDIVSTTTKPGYPTPHDWCDYLGLDNQELPLNIENGFCFSIGDIENGADLIMMNYPHNPTGQIVTEEWLKVLCKYCSNNGIRLFNDAAYYALSHTVKSCALSEVAPLYPKLSWAEAFSSSKLIGNGTGWRVGAMVGSPDFIGDIRTIKGNTDSGFVAPMAAGVIHAVENDWKSIRACRNSYYYKSKLLIEILTNNGMRLAVEPKAGFFTLWETPERAFGVQIKDAEHFNFLMIENTGLVGVHFDPYIRYAVCSDIEATACDIDLSFKKAKISY